MIAVVFYHGEKPWNWPKSLKKGLWGRILQEIPPSLERDMLDYGIRVLDTHDHKVTGLSQEKIKKLKNGI